jgi:uncharacterized membrane protein
LSDGVFGIAIRLLALDVRVPARPAGQLTQALLDTWPSLLAYAVTFPLIGQVWASHHVMFAWIQHSEQLLVVFEIALLACVALQPVPTRLVAESLQHGTGGDLGVALAAYNGLLALGGVFYNAVWQTAVRAGLLRDDLDPRLVRAQSKRYAAGPALYLLATPLALVAAPASAVLDVALIAGYLLPSPDLRAESSAAQRQLPD